VFDRLKVVALSNDGLSWRQIGERLGISFMAAGEAYAAHVAACKRIPVPQEQAAG